MAPERFTENVCSGVLAPGVEGAVGHHFSTAKCDPEMGWASTRSARV